jgi:hypothetical protein
MKHIFLTFSAAILCFGNPAKGAIIYTNIADQTLSEFQNIDVDFNSDGTHEFSFVYDMTGPGIIFSNSNQHLTTVSVSEPDVLHGLNSGSVINSTSGFYDTGNAYIDPFWATTWFPNDDTYLGAKFNIGTETFYGWILVNWNGGGVFVVKSYAYENTPNTNIVAGSINGENAFLNEMETSQTFISPNPVIDAFKIENHDLESGTIVLFSLSGKIEKTIKVTDLSKEILLTDLPSGVYILHLTTDQSFYTQVLLKN